MLIVFAGLPGTGKTTLARALSQAVQASCLRIDTIEQALRNTCGRRGLPKPPPQRLDALPPRAG